MANQKLGWWIAFFGGALGVILATGLDFLSEGVQRAIFIIASCFATLSLFMICLRSPLGEKINRWQARKRRERKQMYFLLLTGTQTAREGGKIYEAGQLVPLDEKDLEIESKRVEYGYERRIAGPIDIKAWEKLMKNKQKDSRNP